MRRIVEATGAALPGRSRASGPAGAASSPPPTPRVSPSTIASANWLASATLVARRLGDALFVDLGSTTTDILLLAGGEVRADGMTDRERLATGELVYTGLTRTPVMALAAEAPFAGRWVALMNELFATTADVHRVLGWLPEDADQHPAADGGPKTATASARRLARMVGADLADGGLADWRRLAGWLARASSAGSRTPWPSSSRAG